MQRQIEREREQEITASAEIHLSEPILGHPNTLCVGVLASASNFAQVGDSAKMPKAEPKAEPEPSELKERSRSRSRGRAFGAVPPPLD